MDVKPFDEIKAMQRMRAILEGANASQKSRIVSWLTSVVAEEQMLKVYQNAKAAPIERMSLAPAGEAEGPRL